MNIYRRLAIAGAMFVCGLSAFNVAAQDTYPSKEMQIIMTHSLGGGQDRLTRAFAKVWQEHFGSPIEVVPRDGAAGRVGFDAFQRLEANGYNTMSANLGTTSIMYVSQDPEWDWEGTLYPVTTFGIDPAAFFVHKDSSFKTMKDVIEAAKERPLTVVINRWDSVEHILLRQLEEQTGAQFDPVSSGGGGDTVTMILGQHGDLGFNKVSNIEQAGDDVRYLALAMDENAVPQLTNNVPTVDDALNTDTVEVASYRAILVHREFKEDYPERFEHLRSSIEAAKNDPDYIKAAAREGVDKDLIGKRGHDWLVGIVRSYWEAFEEYSEAFE